MNLITLSGQQRTGAAFSLFSFAGSSPAGITQRQILELDDPEAGIMFLKAITEAYPGITWGELLNFRRSGLAEQPPPQLAGIGDFFGRQWDNFTDAVSDTGDKLGEWGGDIIRLVTDKEVVDGVSRYGTAYATGGGSEGIRAFMENLGGGDPSQIMDFLGNIGRQGKTAIAGTGQQLIAGVDNKYLMMGAAGLILLVLIIK